MAISDSVTVSIGDDTSGALIDNVFVSGDVKSTSSDAKSMYPGKMIKSLCKYGREKETNKCCECSGGN